MDRLFIGGNSKPRDGMPAENTKKQSESRRSNKPIMEKRRRARINSCLNELKSLILDAMKKDPARHSKLEKADILEMTVRHLQTLQRQQLALAVATDPSVINKYRAGFNECAAEVTRYMESLEPTTPDTKQRLLSHLASCLSGLPGSSSSYPSAAPQTVPAGPLHVQIPSMDSSTNQIVGGLQLVPTRLPNGDLAFVLPAQAVTVEHPSSAASRIPPSHASEPPHHLEDKPLALTTLSRHCRNSVSPANSLYSVSSSSSLSPSEHYELLEPPPTSTRPDSPKPLDLVKVPVPADHWRPW